MPIKLCFIKVITELLQTKKFIRFIFQICGDVKGMAMEVTDAWTKLLGNYFENSKDPIQATEYLATMRKERRFVVDAWC